jgi:hypothetical protein
MHAQPQRTLKRLLKQYGRELIEDPRRTEALLRDLCGQHTREIFVLVNAQKQRVPIDLLAAPTWMPRQATYTRLSRLLQTKLALTEDAADWAVAAWAAALDLDTSPKGESWSWLPKPLHTPAPPTSRKSSRSKKRQNTPSAVQYNKESSRNPVSPPSNQRATRALRAEMGWQFPKLKLALPANLWKTPGGWTNLLPWVALVAATIFLLAVVYWTSSLRAVPINANDASQATAYAAENSTGSNNVPVTPIGLAAQSELQLSAAPKEYLNAVFTLPTWASVDVITLNVRQEPTLASNILDFLPNGEALHVIAFSNDGEWSQIDRPRAGWVSNDFLLFKSQDATLTSIQLNVHPRRTQSYPVEVRKGPRPEAGIEATLPPGTVVVVVASIATAGSESPSWVQIAEPAIGWIAGNDLLSALP